MKTLQKISKSVVAAGSAVLAFPGVVLAQVGSAVDQPAFTPVDLGEAGFRITDLGRLIQGVMNLVLFIAALLVLGYLIWGGVQWITSGGDKGKTEEARNKITSAIIGLAVVAASYALFRIVLYFLGINDPLGGIENLPTAY